MKGFCLGAVIVGFVALGPHFANGADGDLDPAFGDSGVAWLGGPDTYGQPEIAIQDDGRIIVCDAVLNAMFTEDIVVTRFHPDGTPDQTFGSNGSTTLPLDASGDKDLCAGVAVQPDGKIVLAGTRYQPSFPGSIPEFFVARIEASGALDTTFGSGTGFSQFAFDGFDAAIANAVALDANGSIVVVGFAGPQNFSEETLVAARLLPDGELDSTFNGTGQLSVPLIAQATHVAFDATGRIVMTGGGGCSLVRVLPDGSLDDSFGDGGIVRCGIAGSSNGFFIDDHGRFVVAGSFPTGISDSDLSVARMLQDGSLDSTFGNGGVTVIPFDLVSTGQGSDIAIQVVGTPDQKIVALGYAEYQSAGNGYQYAVAARVDAAGLLDPSFGVGGKAVFAFAQAPPSQQRFVTAAVGGGRVIAASGVMDEDSSLFWGDVLVRLENDAIFEGRFD